MGSSPSTAKDFQEGETASLQFAACGMRGWRDEMEDFRCAHANIDGEEISFFGVFDGHGGKDVARFSSLKLVKLITNSAPFKEQNYEVALMQSFLQLDVELRDAAGDIQSFGCGSTAITCLVAGDSVYCANVGDSRAVLCRGGDAIEISRDHKPDISEERMRIEKAGGFVERNRVNGILSMSRALGDHSFKISDLPPDERQVICVPEIKEILIEQRDEFIILASDGVWDAVTSQQAVNLVRQGFNQGHDGKQILSDLFHRCLGQGEDESCMSSFCADLKRVSYDNMTAIIVRFKRLPPLQKMSHPIEAQI